MLNWTNKAPTTPGWYWYKKYKTWKAEIVLVEGVNEADNYYLLFDGWDVKHHEGQWAGPIPEPPPSEEPWIK